MIALVMALHSSTLLFYVSLGHLWDVIITHIQITMEEIVQFWVNFFIETLRHSRVGLWLVWKCKEYDSTLQENWPKQLVNNMHWMALSQERNSQKRNWTALSQERNHWMALLKEKNCDKQTWQKELLLSILLWEGIVLLDISCFSLFEYPWQKNSLC